MNIPEKDIAFHIECKTYEQFKNVEKYIRKKLRDHDKSTDLGEDVNPVWFQYGNTITLEYTMGDYRVTPNAYQTIQPFLHRFTTNEITYEELLEYL